MTEKKRELDAYIKTLKNKVDNLKNYSIACMDKLGVTKLESDLYKLSIPKARKIVNIINVDDLDCKFKTVVHEVKIDKVAVAKALKLGEVKGAEFTDSPNRTLKVGLKK